MWSPVDDYIASTERPQKKGRAPSSLDGILIRVSATFMVNPVTQELLVVRLNEQLPNHQMQFHCLEGVP
jgi:hypothetical protein